MSTIVLLPVSLMVVLAGALLFTNAIEWLGAKLVLAQGAVGSPARRRRQVADSDHRSGPGR